MWSADQIPPERLIAPLVVLDVRSSVADNADYQVRVEDIVKWEQANGQIPLGAIVMARTGWDARWSSTRTYRNANAKGAMTARLLGRRCEIPGRSPRRHGTRH